MSECILFLSCCYLCVWCVDRLRGRVPTLYIQADSLGNLIQAVGGPALVASLLLSASAAYQEGTIGQDTEIFNIQ